MICRPDVDRKPSQSPTVLPWACVSAILAVMTIALGCAGNDTGGSATNPGSSTSTSGECTTGSMTDVLNCGGCGIKCSSNHGVPVCTNGMCEIACSSGYADCNNDVNDGCEVSLNQDPAHCGTCEKACSTVHSTPECITGGCAVEACEAGWADCNNNPADGCEVDLNNDFFNCGACKKNCQGAGCNGGVCGPLPTVLDDGAVSENTSGNGIAIDNTYVYWTTSNKKVFKIPVAGGTAVLVAGAQEYCEGVAVDATTLYFAATPSVYSVPLSGGGPVALATNLQQPWAVTVDSSYVYWVERLSCAVSRVPKGGGATQILSGPVAGDVCQSIIAVDNANIYWGQQMLGVMSVPKTGGTASVLGPGTNPGGVAADGTYVYWVTAVGDLMKVPASGGSPVTLAPGKGGGTGVLALDASFAYWERGGGTIMKVSKAGGTPVMVASNQGAVGALAIDATSVYWVLEGPAKLFKMAK